MTTQEPKTEEKPGRVTRAMRERADPKCEHCLGTGMKILLNTWIKCPCTYPPHING